MYAGCQKGRSAISQEKSRACQEDFEQTKSFYVHTTTITTTTSCATTTAATATYTKTATIMTTASSTAEAKGIMVKLT